MFKRIRGTCHEGNVCPTLMLDTETNEVLMQGPVLDPIKAAALRVPGGEGVVRVPADLLCGLTQRTSTTMVRMSRMLSIDQLGNVLDDTRRDLYRWEALPAYEVPTDGSDFHRWLAGEPAPAMERKQIWLDTLGAWAEQGRPRRRVRVIHNPPSDYERYSCEWGYVHTATAGERIRVLDLAETALPSELVAVSDFWLIDGERVVLMHYNPDYTFAGGELLDPSDSGPYRNAASVAWQLGRDFGSWWVDHPQHRRSVA